VLALALAIGQLVGIELRLLALLWHVGRRWGTLDGDTILLPVHLTHKLLASVISAQRATVTRALGSLCDDGLLSRRDDGLYVLHGGPRAQFRLQREA
jgi:CRP/FNR family transcriptional regulator, cyclic AMP receptor protein